MSLFAKKLLLTVCGLAVAAGSAGALATIASYKPFGVHDLQRAEYEAILQKLDERDRLSSVPKPVSKVISTAHPGQVCKPGESVVSRLVVRNAGDVPLYLSLPKTPSTSITLKESSPITIPPGDSTELNFEWVVPKREEELAGMRARLVTNDPLTPMLTLEASCRLASRFAASEEPLEVAQPFGTSGSTTLFVYSQVHSDITISKIDADPQLVVSFEPELDETLLGSNEATSGLSIKIMTPIGLKPGITRTQIRLTVASSETNDSEEIVVPFAWKVTAPFAFFSDALDARTGLRLGVIPLGSTQSWTLFARSATAVSEEDLRVEVQPDSLAVAVSRTRKDSNDFKITISLKPDAKPIEFQGATKGYIKLSLASNPAAINVLPLRGVIITPARNGP